MITTVDVAEASAENNYKYAILPFYKDEKPFTDSGAAHWGMSLRAAGSMRFRWNETNHNRDAFLQNLACGAFANDKGVGTCVQYKNGAPQQKGKEARRVVPLELIHSKKVYDLKSGAETFQQQGDGMITQNKNLIPVVTVADCVPLYLYDPQTQIFGVVHSGWKGTGIIGEAIKLAAANYGAKPKNILVAIGAHIHDCCYFVDGERAKYFTDNFGAACVQKCADLENAKGFSMPLCVEQLKGFEGGAYRLSLLKANLAVLEKSGVLEENIVAAQNCTCCDERFGSFRRQAAFSDVEDKSKAFTVQAAFVCA